MKTTAKLQSVCVCVCYGKRGACTFVHISIIHFEISNRMKHQAISTGRYATVSCVESAEGDLGGTDVLTTTGQHFGTSKVSRAPW